MRRMIKGAVLLFAAAAMVLPAKAQKIIMDKTNSNGLRSTMTEAINCRSFKDRVVVSVGLSSIIAGEDTTLTMDLVISANKKIKVPSGGQLLIKLGDGTVKNFTTDLGGEDTIGKSSYIAHTLITTYTAVVPYDMTKDEFEEIMAKGVQKIRIEMSPENFEKEYSKNEIGAAVVKLYPALMSAISVPKSFDSDF